MTKNVYRAYAVLASSLSLAAASLGAQNAKAEFKSFVQKETPLEAAAIEHKDSAYFEKLYSPDFKTKDEHGVTNGKKVALFLLRYHFNTLQKVHYHAKLLSLEAAGNVGTVKVMTVLDGVTQGRHGAKSTPLKVTRIEKQVFIKKGDKWLMSLDEDLKKPMVLLTASQVTAPMKIAPAKKH